MGRTAHGARPKRAIVVYPGPVNTRRQWLALLVGVAAIVAALSNGPQSELVTTRDAGNASAPLAAPSVDDSFPDLGTVETVESGESVASAPRPRAVGTGARATPAAPTRRVAGTASAAPAASSPAVSNTRRDPFPETIVLNARSSRGVVTQGKVEPGRAYRIVASGSYGWAAVRTFGQQRHRPQADAECSSAGDEAAARNAFEATEPGQDPLDVYINGVQVDWRPVGTNNQGCSPDNVYDFYFVPQDTAAMHFVVRDASYGDNLGSITITIID